MTISKRCPKCRKEYTLSVKACIKCGTQLTKFIVRVRNQDNNWVTKTVGSLSLAR